MGLPAVKRDHTPAVSRPHLRVVKPNERARASKPKARAKAAHSGAYQAFVFFAVLVGVITVLGAGRVWMSVQAAQASIDCGKLQTAIKAARYQGDMLEIQASALSAPSRVQAIAQGQLDMAPATSVSYMHITEGAKPQVVLAENPAPTSAGGSAVVNNLVGIVAAQARMLMVGDVGLSSSR